MRRLVIALGLAALVLAAPAPKPPAVTNPLTVDLDAGGHSITNAQSVYAANFVSVGTIFSGQAGIPGAIQFSDGTHPNGPAITAGTAIPTDPANPGSLYLRWNADGTGELWLAVAADTWQRIAP